MEKTFKEYRFLKPSIICLRFWNLVYCNVFDCATWRFCQTRINAVLSWYILEEYPTSRLRS